MCYSRKLVALATIWFLSIATVAHVQPSLYSDAKAYSYESFVAYVRDYHSQKAYRSTKVTHDGWFQTGNYYAFNTWTVEAYANIMLTSYQYHYVVFARDTQGYPTSDRTYWAWNLSYGNTPSYIPRSYSDFIDTTSSIALLSGTAKNQNTLYSPFDTAWSEVTAPYHTNSLYGSGSGISTSYP